MLGKTKNVLTQVKACNSIQIHPPVQMNVGVKALDHKHPHSSYLLSWTKPEPHGKLLTNFRNEQQQYDSRWWHAHMHPHAFYLLAWEWSSRSPARQRWWPAVGCGETPAGRRCCERWPSGPCCAQSSPHQTPLLPHRLCPTTQTSARRGLTLAGRNFIISCGTF